MKKLYIQPQSDLVRNNAGEPLMAKITEGLPGSSSATEPGTTAPARQQTAVW